MTNLGVLAKGDDSVPVRIAGSVLAGSGRISDLADFHRWFAEYGEHAYIDAHRVPLDELTGWSTDLSTGNIRHDSGKFFTVEGLDAHIPDGPVSRWGQPIINQPEIGVLGIVVKQFAGVLHCLMQAKVEPGNHNGLQLSPTVQATRSNYTGVHRGKSVAYLEYFKDTARHRVLADVRQSEQGSWFHQKCNRNMVIEVFDDVEMLPGFCWLTIGQVHQLLRIDDLVNMDARTVLSCLPFAGGDVVSAFSPDGDDFRTALIRACGEGGLHSMDEILSWVTEARTRSDVYVSRVPLNQLESWHRSDGRIVHESGLFFDVIGVSVRAGGREVGQWTQPMIEARDRGAVAFLVAPIDGVLHALVHARIEPGYVDKVELAPTVQGTPENYAHLPAAARPAFLDEVLTATPEQIRFQATLSEEGGRFYHARNQYSIIEVTPQARHDHPDYRWMTLNQLVDLLRHSFYLNIQARSLVACLHSLSAA